jgi:hypothetical protein
MKERNVYLAGKLNSGEASISAIAEEIEAAGHSVIEKWWTKAILPTPYLTNLETSSVAASAMISAAYECDVFVLFPSSDILGAAVELGAALASTVSNPDKLVIVNDPGSTRQSVFYAHPAVIAINGLSALREMEWFNKSSS